METAVEEMRRHRISKELEEQREAKFDANAKRIKSLISSEQLVAWKLIETLIKSVDEYPDDLRTILMETK